MSIEGIILSVILITLVLVLVGLPLIRRTDGREAADALAEKQRERLTVYYERVLRNIRDLDEDHALGKLATGDYEQEREQWAARGVQVLKALDTLENQPMLKPSAAEDTAVDHAIDDAIEAAVRDLRRASQPTDDRVIG